MNANPKIAPVAVAAISSGTPSGEFDNRQSSVADEAERAARYRLVIEEGPQKGSFVYKTLDRVTGEVIRQFPREEVLKLRQSPAYDVGKIIKTEA